MKSATEFGTKNNRASNLGVKESQDTPADLASNVMIDPRVEWTYY